jgi:hypothetical protein
VFLKFGDRRRIASELRIGDVVERHLDRELAPLLIVYERLTAASLLLLPLHSCPCRTAAEGKPAWVCMPGLQHD